MLVEEGNTYCRYTFLRQLERAQWIKMLELLKFGPSIQARIKIIQPLYRTYLGWTFLFIFFMYLLYVQMLKIYKCKFNKRFWKVLRIVQYSFCIAFRGKTFWFVARFFDEWSIFFFLRFLNYFVLLLVL